MPTRTVTLLVLAIGAVGANSLSLSPIAGRVAHSFDGVAAADVMLAAVAYGAATALSALTLAPLADRVGAARALVWALAGFAASLLLAAAAPALLVLILGQACAGLAAGLGLPAIYTLARQVAPPGRANATLSAVLTGWTLSLVVGVSGAALIAEWLSWRVVLGGIGAVAGALALGVAAVSWGAPAGNGQRTSPITALRVPGARATLALVAGYMIAFYGLYSYLGPHLHDALGASTAVIGLVPLVYGLGFGVAAPLGHLIDRVGEQRAAPFAFLALAAVYTLLAAVAHSLAAVIAAAFAWGFVNHVGLNLMVGRLGALDARQSGAILGLYGAVTYLALSLGALMYRPVFELGGLVACAAVSSLCVLPAVVMARSWARVRHA